LNGPEPAELAFSQPLPQSPSLTFAITSFESTTLATIAVKQ
jgi:hypothetical protein